MTTPGPGIGSGTDSITIRPAVPADAPALVRVLIDTKRAAHRGQLPDHLLDTPPLDQQYAASARNWRRALRELAAPPDSREQIVVAVDSAAGERIVGLAMGGPSRRSEPDLAAYPVEVTVLYVALTHQRRGIGRRLVCAVVRHLAGDGLLPLIISCLTANAPARRFYEVLGGRLVGETVFEDQGERLSGVIYGWTAPDVLRHFDGRGEEPREPAPVRPRVRAHQEPVDRHAADEAQTELGIPGD